MEKEEGANRELPEGFIPGGFVTDILILIWARKSPWRLIRGGAPFEPTIPTHDSRVSHDFSSTWTAT